MSTSTRRLAAIWFADIVSHSRHAATDEDAALRVLELLYQVAADQIERHGGRLVKRLGDGALAEFGSTEAAIRAALALQGDFRQQSRDAGVAAQLRVGVHVGEVVTLSGGDVIGDGVNKAARIQQVAEPGQVLVSEDVWRHVRQRKAFAFRSVPKRSLAPLVEDGWDAALYEVELATDPAALDARRPRSGWLPSRTLRQALLLVGLSYAAAAALVVAAGAAFPGLGWPNASPNLLLALCGVGIAFTIPGAWLLDRAIGGAAWKRRRASGGRRRSLVIGGLGGLVAACTLLYVLGGEAAANDPELGRVVAVLPFATDGDARGVDFAEGVGEDIQTQLTMVPGLRVISSTTMRQYRNADRTIPQIAAELRASSILEGSVRRQGDRVRVSVRLVDVERDQPVWSHTFDREATDIFAVQSAIAIRIAEELGAQLSSGVKDRVAEPPTESMAAYRHYQQAQRLWLTPVNLFENRNNAILFYERALELDSTFVLALAGLARLYHFRGRCLVPGSVTADNQWGQTEPCPDTARVLAEKALRLGPEVAEAHEAYGLIVHQKSGDLEAARRAYLRALELKPSFPLAHAGLALTYETRGRPDLALPHALRALELQPTSRWRARTLIGLSLDLADYDAARRWIDRTEAVFPDSAETLYYLARVRLLTGDTAGARLAAERAAEMRPQFTPTAGYVALVTGDTARAQAHYERSTAVEFGLPDVEALYLQYLNGDRAEATRLLEEMAASYREDLDRGWPWGGKWHQLARVHAVLGDSDQVIKRLKEAVERGWLRYDYLIGDPLLAPYRSDPRFQEIVNELRRSVRVLRERTQPLLGESAEA